MHHAENNNPLYGVRLDRILKELVNEYGREKLSERIDINCFSNNPTIKSCLKFLRNVKFEWARKKVEQLYIDYKIK